MSAHARALTHTRPRARVRHALRRGTNLHRTRAVAVLGQRVEFVVPAVLVKPERLVFRAAFESAKQRSGGKDVKASNTTNVAMIRAKPSSITTATAEKFVENEYRHQAQDAERQRHKGHY